MSKSSATAAAREPDDLVCVAIVKGKRTGSTWLARTLHNEPCVDRFIPPGHAPDLKLKQQAFETAFDVDDVLSDPAFADSCKAFDTRPANGSRAAAYFDRFRDAQACSPQNFSAALRDSRATTRNPAVLAWSEEPQLRKRITTSWMGSVRGSGANILSSGRSSVLMLSSCWYHSAG